MTQSAIKIHSISKLLKWWLVTGLLILVALGILVFTRSSNFSWAYVGEIFAQVIRQPVFYLLSVVPYLIYQVFRYFAKIKQEKGWLLMGQKLLLTLVLPLAAFIGCSKVYQNTLLSENTSSLPKSSAFVNKTGNALDRFAKDQKQRGVHLFMRQKTAEASLDILSSSNFEWITLVPYGSMSNRNSTEVDSRRQTAGFSRRDSSFISISREAHLRNFKVMLKPHLWLSDGAAVGRAEISFSNEADWQSWEAGYEKFILHHAKLAELVKAEQFCVGTELKSIVIERPDFFPKLIKKVRAVYSGKLTYAANWYEELEAAEFWGDLDYIGVQAYFPLADKDNPELEEIKEGWAKHTTLLKDLSKKYDRPVLFTEIGYKSTADAAKEPWKWLNFNSTWSDSKSLKTQALCYQALFETVWSENWFAGIHVWQWRGNHEETGGEDDRDFTPQNKPAQWVITDGFARKPKHWTKDLLPFF